MKKHLSILVLLLVVVPAAALAVDYGGPYTEPPSNCTPPNCNVAAPINVGTSEQTKQGTLYILRNLIVSGGVRSFLNYINGLFVYIPDPDLMALNNLTPAQSAPGPNKVLASISTDGSAVWKSLADLCTATGACGGGATTTSYWSLKPITAQLENNNPNGRVAVKTDLNVGNSLSVSGSSTLNDVGIFGTDALEFGYFSIAPAKAANAGKIRYNKDLAVGGRQSLDVYGGGTAIGDRLVNVYDNLNVNGDIYKCTGTGNSKVCTKVGQPDPFHSADLNKDWVISQGEVTSFQSGFLNKSYGCSSSAASGYVANSTDKKCKPHSADTNGDWKIEAGEFTRVTQLYNTGGYSVCNYDSEDGFAPYANGEGNCQNSNSGGGGVANGTEFGQMLYWDATKWVPSSNIINDVVSNALRTTNVISSASHYKQSNTQAGHIKTDSSALIIDGVNFFGPDDASGIRMVRINSVLNVLSTTQTNSLIVKEGVSGAATKNKVLADISGSGQAVWTDPNTLVSDGLPIGLSGQMLYHNGTKWVNSIKPIQITNPTSATPTVYINGNTQVDPINTFQVSKLQISNQNHGTGKVLVSDASGFGTWIATSSLGIGGGTDFWGGSATGNVYNTNTGNVGIGTQAPASVFTVQKNMGGGRGGEITINNGANAQVGSESALNFGLETSTYNADAGNAQIKARLMNTNGSTDLIFSGWNGSAGAGGSFSEYMRIKSGGNVGIGVPNPDDKLDVAGNIVGTGIVGGAQGVFGNSGVVSSGLITSNTGFTTTGTLNVAGAATLSGGLTAIGSSTITTLTSSGITTNQLKINGIAGALPGNNRVLASDATGNATWKDLSTLCTATGSCGSAGGTDTRLVSGTAVHQTLRWGGSAWSPSSALTNTGTDVGVANNLTVGGSVTTGGALVKGQVIIGDLVNNPGRYIILGGSSGSNPPYGQILATDKITTNGQFCLGSNCISSWPTAGAGLPTGTTADTNFTMRFDGATWQKTGHWLVGPNAANGGVAGATLTGDLTLIGTGNIIAASLGLSGGLNVGATTQTANLTTTNNFKYTRGIPFNASGVGGGTVGQVLMSSDTSGNVVWGNMPAALTAGAGLQVVGGVVSVKNGGIVTTMIGDNQVTTAKIADDQVTKDKIKGEAVRFTNTAIVNCAWQNPGSGNNATDYTASCDRVVDGVTPTVSAPTNFNLDYIFSCPANYEAISGGGWCDSSNPAFADYYLRENRLNYASYNPNGSTGWKLSCQKGGTSESSGRRRPGGAVLTCLKRS
jgi:hypothetical protein